MIIGDSLQANLSIGGMNYDLSPDTFETICICENVGQLLPACRLILDDIMGFFDQVPLVDGMPILIQMASLRNDSESFTYPFISLQPSPMVQPVL